MLLIFSDTCCQLGPGARARRRRERREREAMLEEGKRQERVGSRLESTGVQEYRRTGAPVLSGR